MKKKQTHRYEEQTTGYHWEEGKGDRDMWIADQEVQTLGIK